MITIANSWADLDSFQFTILYILLGSARIAKLPGVARAFSFLTLDKHTVSASPCITTSSLGVWRIQCF